LMHNFSFTTEQTIPVIYMHVSFSHSRKLLFFRSEALDQNCK
jgi:hypothetical protein